MDIEKKQSISITPRTDSIVAVLNTHTEAEKIVKELQKMRFDMKKLSIVARDCHAEGLCGAHTMSNHQGLVWRQLPLGNDSIGASHIVPWFVLSTKSDKERTGIMLYVLRSHCGFDVGPIRALGWPASYCGIRPRTRHGDDKLRGNHGKDSRSYGASTDRSP